MADQIRSRVHKPRVRWTGKAWQASLNGNYAVGDTVMDAAERLGAFVRYLNDRDAKDRLYQQHRVHVQAVAAERTKL